MPELDDPRQRQHGVVLVTCLLLAGLLAILAALSVQSTTADLQAVAGDRWRLRALVAAENCVATLGNALLAGTSGALPVDIPDTPIAGQPGDSMRCSAQLLGSDVGVAERSGAALAGSHYVLLATGSSLRSAQVSVEVGLLVVRDAAGVVRSAQTSYWMLLP
jgi:hypothetical protein